MEQFQKSFLCIVLFFTAFMQAQSEPNFNNNNYKAKKSSLRQIYGMYKIALGGAMVLSGAQLIYSDPQRATNFINNHGYDIVTTFVGAQVMYNGMHELLKKPNNNLFFTMHQKCVDSIVLSQSSVFAAHLLSLFKRKTMQLLNSYFL